MASVKYSTQRIQCASPHSEVKHAKKPKHFLNACRSILPFLASQQKFLPYQTVMIQDTFIKHSMTAVIFSRPRLVFHKKIKAPAQIIDMGVTTAHAITNSFCEYSTASQIRSSLILFIFKIYQLIQSPWPFVQALSIPGNLRFVYVLNF